MARRNSASVDGWPTAREVCAAFIKLLGFPWLMANARASARDSAEPTACAVDSARAISLPGAVATVVCVMLSARAADFRIDANCAADSENACCTARAIVAALATEALNAWVN